MVAMVVGFSSSSAWSLDRHIPVGAALVAGAVPCWSPDSSQGSSASFTGIGRPNSDDMTSFGFLPGTSSDTAAAVLATYRWWLPSGLFQRRNLDGVHPEMLGSPSPKGCCWQCRLGCVQLPWRPRDKVVGPVPGLVEPASRVVGCHLLLHRRSHCFW